MNVKAELARLDRSIAWVEAQSLAMLEEGVRLFALKERFLAEQAALRAQLPDPDRRKPP